ncbi:unnamed protein product [Dovyalis caffra]|uniref:Uncharacterized protein n=1 Tax=Dovyalis caffra TaxID=77055 RepID=A0AAV1S3L3_9ROSI|nr:unnamed protein product [Dovyalis caffra]
MAIGEWVGERVSCGASWVGVRKCMGWLGVIRIRVRESYGLLECKGVASEVGKRERVRWRKCEGWRCESLWWLEWVKRMMNE